MSKVARLNFLYIGPDSSGNKRCTDIASEFNYSYQAIEDAEKVLEFEGVIEQAQLVVLNASSFVDTQVLAAHLQTIRYVFKETFVLVIGGKRIPQDAIDFIKKSGASMVLLENEFFETSRLEYIASQVIRASYVPVKPSEFPKDCVLDFTLYHLMPLNQKLLPVLPKGSPLTESRLKKLDGVGEVYIKREEVERYKHFVETHPDPSGGGLKKRCRAQYLNFCNSHSQLMFLLIDQSAASSFKEGKWLYDRCEVLARDLLTTLSAVGEAWDIVNNSSIGEFGSVERCPTVAAYVGLISLLSSIGDPVDLMVASLLSDIGMLELHPSVSRKMRELGDWQGLTGEALESYKKHPLISLNRCLDRKLQMKDAIRDMILSTHEKVDGKGFPNGKFGEKIPVEAQIIQFVEKVDRAGMIKMGQARVDIAQVRKQILTDLMQEGKTISLAVLSKIKPFL